MPKINTNDFRKAIKVTLDGEPYLMLDVEFRKPGKGQALYRTRLKNLLKGTILDRTYKSGDSLESADVHTGDGQYLYRDASGYIFMDNETFEQQSLPEETCGEQIKFLLEGTTVHLMYWNGQLIAMDPPQHVVLEVTATEPAARGDTATNVTKPCTVETGAQVQVPAFVNQGDKIKVDAAAGTYIERVRD